MSEILITGGAGMIGRKLAERLAHDGTLAGRKIDRLVLQDIVQPAPLAAPFEVGAVAGDFATGMRSTSVLSVTGDFATGTRRSPRLTRIGDFATGMRAVSAAAIVDDFRSAENELPLAA